MCACVRVALLIEEVGEFFCSVNNWIIKVMASLTIVTAHI